MKVTLISNNEICYNPRLLKAADYLSEKGWIVTVFNPITGIASKEVYEAIKEGSKWQVMENDLSKRNLRSKLRWFFSSILHKLIRFLSISLGIESFHKYHLNKGLILIDSSKLKADWYIVNLIDNLPFAVGLKDQYGGKIVYDSQEYFTGQYETLSPIDHPWVLKYEEECIKQVDILLATTEVMRLRLIEDYNFKMKSFRLRNIPSQKQLKSVNSIADSSEKDSETLKLVWHGMWIYMYNRRGVHLLIEAVLRSKVPVKLFLQGKITDEEIDRVNELISKFENNQRIEILPPAAPNKIVESLVNYDVGLTGEIAEEENQELTSSNKLFDFIHAGLAVISSNTKGLRETVEEYDLGELYTPGSVAELIMWIEKLALDRTKLKKYKLNSLSAAKNLSWENDYAPIEEEMRKKILAS